MGREHELLEAARSGNVSVIEKLLNPRKKLTVGSLPLSLGPLSRLGRTINPNCQDQNGDTPLHLAALNGHIDAVKMLLKYEASANTMDNKGCFPLHLAAWSGNAEMCNVLLSHGPSLAKVNEQNYCGETALHCAAQYGHTATVAVLLPHLADPLIRNDHSETPLDLASLYGRLDTVELLIRKCPSLIADHTEALSPLHLASRNGHRAVVQLLLEAGFDLNKTTESGTALHEASIFGKQEVVRLLLRKGINASLTDSESRTVLEVLSEHKSQLSLDIGRIVLDYLEGRSISDKRSSTQSASSDPLDPIYDRPVPDSDVVIGGERRLSARSSGDSSGVFGATGARLSTTSESYFLYDTPKGRPIPPGLEEVDAISDTSGSPASATGGLSSLSSLTPSLAICNSGSISSRSPQGTPPIATPETPKKPPRRKPPSQIIGAKPRGPSPPRMVFINKRPSTTSSRDSTGSVTEKSGSGNNDNNNAPGNNNITAVSVPAVMTAAHNDNENNSLKCDINNQQGAATVSKGDDDDDVTNSNHQVASSTVLTTTTARDSLRRKSETIEEVTCAKKETRLESTVDNENNKTTDNNLNIEDDTTSRIRRSKRSANKDESEASDEDESSGNISPTCTRSVLCRDSVELAKAGKSSEGGGSHARASRAVQKSVDAPRLSQCDQVFSRVEVVEGPSQPLRLSEYDRESNGHVTLA